MQWPDSRLQKQWAKSLYQRVDLAATAASRGWIKPLSARVTSELPHAHSVGNGLAEQLARWTRPGSA